MSDNKAIITMREHSAFPTQVSSQVMTEKFKWLRSSKSVPELHPRQLNDNCYYEHNNECKQTRHMGVGFSPCVPQVGIVFKLVD